MVSAGVPVHQAAQSRWHSIHSGLPPVAWISNGPIELNQRSNRLGHALIAANWRAGPTDWRCWLNVIWICWDVNAASGKRGLLAADPGRRPSAGRIIDLSRTPFGVHRGLSENRYLLLEVCLARDRGCWCGRSW